MDHAGHDHVVAVGVALIRVQKRPDLPGADFSAVIVRSPAFLRNSSPRAAGKSVDCCFCAKPRGREPFIHTSPDHDTDQDRLLAALWLHPQTRFTTRDGFTAYNMVAAGLGA